jgi:YggT family protein
MNPLVNALVFLINIIFYFFMLAIWLRFLLQCVRADFYNPVSQFVIKVTNPVLKPLRRIIPGYFGVDMAALVLLYMSALVQVWLLNLLMLARMPKLVGWLMVATADVLNLAVNVFFFAILIRAIISWVNPRMHSPFTVILFQLTEPLLRPARRWINPIGGLDLSPLIVMIGLQLVAILLIYPLLGLGQQWL